MTKTKQAPKTKKLPNDVTFSIAIDTKVRQALQERADRDRRSMSFIVREAIERYLGVEQAPAV
jgi:predicted transcriptional regulator